jgi:hypothetical protein
MSKTHLNNTQRKVVRKYLSRKYKLKEKIPFGKLIEQNLFRGIDIQHLKKLFRNEEQCIQDEERRKQVVAMKRMKNVVTKQGELMCEIIRDQDETIKRLEGEEARGQVQDKNSAENQDDEENFQQLVSEVIRKDKELKNYQHIIEKQRLRIKELHSRCKQSYEINNRNENERHSLELEFLRAEKEREYFKKCTKEWQYEYERLHRSISRGYVHDQKDYWELHEQLKSSRLKLDSLSFATAVEQEVKVTVRLLCEMKPKARVRGWMPMREMREIIIKEGNELKKQNLIPYFYGDDMNYRAEEYSIVRNKMAHEHYFIYQMDHKSFQLNAKWIIKHLQVFQDELQRLRSDRRRIG